MQSRMSRLRRSLSRSVLQLQALQSLSRSQSHLPDPLPPSTTDQADMQLVEKFASPSTFSQLRHIIQTNNDSLREIISIFDEKVALDIQYGRGLHKLAARLHKLTQRAECEIDKGWSSAAEQFDLHASIHTNLASAITDDIVQPLRAIAVNEEKSIRATSLFVDKHLKKLSEKRADTLRAKRQAYTAARELERLEQSADMDRNNLDKYDGRRKKLEEAVKKSEEAFIFEAIDQEKQRSTTEKILRRAVTSLEAVERQRLAHSQTALGRLQRKIDQLGPSLSQMFERQTNNLDLAVHCSATAFISSLSPSHSALNQVSLTDTFAENLAEMMRGERRKASLERTAATLDALLQRMYATAQPQDLSPCEISLLEYVEYLYYKVSESLNGVAGSSHRGFHRLSRFQHLIKDKAGLPQTVLAIPLSVDLQTGDGSRPPPILSPTSPSRSYSPSFSQATTCNDNCDEYEKISDEGFYNSNSRQTTIEGQGQLCRVLYDFNPTAEDELEVHAGEYVVVEARVGEWLLGHRVISPSANSLSPPTTGRFPASYVAS